MEKTRWIDMVMIIVVMMMVMMTMMMMIIIIIIHSCHYLWSYMTFLDCIYKT